MPIPSVRLAAFERDVVEVASSMIDPRPDAGADDDDRRLPLSDQLERRIAENYGHRREATIARTNASAGKKLRSRSRRIWAYRLSNATALRRVTFGGNNRFPVWSPDLVGGCFLSLSDNPSWESDNPSWEKGWIGSRAGEDSTQGGVR